MLPSKTPEADAVSNNWRNILFEQSFKTVLPWPKGASVSAAQGLPQKNHRNVYMHEIKPMLILLRLMGVISYHTTSSGEIKRTPPLSVASLYALLIRGAILTFTTSFLMERVPQIGEPGAPFLFRIVDVGFTVLFLINYIISITLWIEQNEILRFFTQWQNFQARYTGITRKHLRLKLRRKCLISLVVVFLAAAVLTADSYLLGVKSLWPLWQGAVLAYVVVLALLLPFLWYLTCNALNTSAKMLTSHLNQCHQRYEKLAELRRLWILLSKLTQELGLALGLTYGALCLIYLTMQTICIFAAMFVIQINHAPQATVFLSGAVVFGGLLYLQCDAAEKVTDQVGGGFQQQLEIFAHTQLKRYAALEDEISIFLQCIHVIPPVINYCGFAEVNRYLMSSLMAAVATYVVVLMQFEVSSE